MDHIDNFIGTIAFKPSTCRALYGIGRDVQLGNLLNSCIKIGRFWISGLGEPIPLVPVSFMKRTWNIDIIIPHRMSPTRLVLLSGHDKSVVIEHIGVDVIGGSTHPSGFKWTKPVPLGTGRTFQLQDLGELRSGAVEVVLRNTGFRVKTASLAIAGEFLDV